MAKIKKLQLNGEEFFPLAHARGVVGLEGFTDLAELLATLTGYQFLGLATPTTPAPFSKGQFFWITSTPGIYAQLGNVSIFQGELAIIKYDSAGFHKETAFRIENLIPPSSIQEGMLASSSVSKDKLAKDSVTTSKIKDGAVEFDKLSLALQTLIEWLETGDAIDDGAIKLRHLSPEVLDTFKAPVYLTEAEYQKLVDEGRVEDNVEYNIFEEE